MPLDLTGTLCDWGGASCPPARADGFCSDSHRQAWFNYDRQCEMRMDTEMDNYADFDWSDDE